MVTLPKISDKKEVRDLCKILNKIEKEHKLNPRSIGIEIMIETPNAIVDKKGRIALKDLVKAAKDRPISAHFGAYDYTASLGVSADHQDLNHAACNFARQMMLVSLSPLGVRLSDSVTTELPVPIHKGDDLSQAQTNENKNPVHTAWLKHFQNVNHSMSIVFIRAGTCIQSTRRRYAAIIVLFRSKLHGARLRGFMEKAAAANQRETLSTCDPSRMSTSFGKDWIAGV